MLASGAATPVPPNLPFVAGCRLLLVRNMASTPVVAVVVVLVFAAASFFFALAETSLFSLSKWQADQLAERHLQAGAVVTRLLGQPQDILATLVLGNTFANAAMLAANPLLVPLMVSRVSVMVLRGSPSRRSQRGARDPACLPRRSGRAGGCRGRGRR